MIAEAEQRYWSGRSDITKAVLLIGPDELIASAVAVSAADLDLRRLWFDREPSKRQSASAELAQALQASTRVLDEFSDLARRITAPSRR